MELTRFGKHSCESRNILDLYFLWLFSKLLKAEQSVLNAKVLPVMRRSQFPHAMTPSPLTMKGSTPTVSAFPPSTPTDSSSKKLNSEELARKAQREWLNIQSAISRNKRVFNGDGERIGPNEERPPSAMEFEQQIGGGDVPPGYVPMTINGQLCYYHPGTHDLIEPSASNAQPAPYGQEEGGADGYPSQTQLDFEAMAPELAGTPSPPQAAAEPTYEEPTYGNDESANVLSEQVIAYYTNTFGTYRASFNNPLSNSRNLGSTTVQNYVGITGAFINYLKENNIDIATNTDTDTYNEAVNSFASRDQIRRPNRGPRTEPGYFTKTYARLWPFKPPAQAG